MFAKADYWMRRGVPVPCACQYPCVVLRHDLRALRGCGASGGVNVPSRVEKASRVARLAPQYRNELLWSQVAGMCDPPAKRWRMCVLGAPNFSTFRR